MIDIPNQQPISFTPVHNGTRTSRAAAISMREHAPTQQATVLAWIASRGLTGATIDEISLALSMRTASVCARIGKLRELTRVYDSGRERKTSSGRPAIVWLAKVDA